MVEPELDSLFDDDEKKAQELAELAASDNTRRAYFFDWRHFEAWCQKRRYKSLPASPASVVMYLEYCVVTEKLKVSTVKRRLAAIAYEHERTKNKNPAHEWLVRSSMKSLRRKYGKAPAQKKPLEVADLKRIVELCPPTLSGLRDKALILIGFLGGFRRSDLANLEMADVFKADEGFVFMIREGKTDQKREGRKLGIPFGKHPETCGITALCRWLEAAQIKDGPVFRGVSKHERALSSKLSAQRVAIIVKKYCRLIGKVVDKFSGHSLRAGLATEAWRSGASERAIMKQTGHVDVEMVRRYIREANIFIENAAGKVDL